jgi:predicted alpha/beta-hydrolase family hydrolase
MILKSEHHEAEASLLLPAGSKLPGVILGHGAGADMNSPFMTFFHQKLAGAGHPCMKFNFPYSQKKKKVPDPQPVLVAFFRKAIEAMPAEDVVIGGKSMGGRISSYVADEDRVKGLIFLGYPLHPPGKIDQLRDEHLYSIRKPMFFVSGTRDPFAKKDLLDRTLQKIGKYASLYSVEGGGHSLEVPRKSGKNQQQILEAAAAAIVDWMKRL